MMYKEDVTSGPVDKILSCGNSNESYFTIRTVYYAVQGASSVFYGLNIKATESQSKNKLQSSTLLFFSLVAQSGTCF